jgi:hypothetical protein
MSEDVYSTAIQIDRGLSESTRAHKEDSNRTLYFVSSRSKVFSGVGSALAGVVVVSVVVLMVISCRSAGMDEDVEV